jgi:hypothetical protein
MRRVLKGTVTLVLNSPGGRLDKAQRIMDLLVDPPSGTEIDGAYVPENGECYSACAFIFMHAGYGKQAALKMHYSAKLGFHAPWLKDLDYNRSYTAQDILVTATLSQITIKNLMKHGRIPLELLLEFLDKGPNDFYLIDTPYKAARLGILVGGFFNYELYRRQVDWSKDGWFGLVVPTKETAFWAMLQSGMFEEQNPLSVSVRSGKWVTDLADAIEADLDSRFENLFAGFETLQSMEELYGWVERGDLQNLKDEMKALRVKRLQLLHGYEVVRFMPRDENWPIVQFSRHGLEVQAKEHQFLPFLLKDASCR